MFALLEVMRMSTMSEPNTDREMYSIAKEEHEDCTAALEELQMALTSLLLPR